MGISTKFALPDKYGMYVPARALQRSGGLLGPDGTQVKNILRGPLAKYFLQGIAGGAPGFNEVADVITVLADGTDANVLWREYQETVRIRNAERQPLVDFLSYFVSQDVEAIYSADSTARFERASEYGIPRSHRPSGAPSYMGFDFSWFDLGMRFTW